MFCRFITALSVIVCAFIVQSIAVSAEDATLPGGASSLREAYGDWTVACVLQPADNKKHKICALTQEQVDAKTRKRALALDLKPDGRGVKGTLVLPFGLALEKGANFVIDDGKSGGARPFRTCLPVGCLIDIAFDAVTVAALKSAKTLKVQVVADGGQEMTLSISLSGFPGAYDRVAALLN